MYVGGLLVVLSVALGLSITLLFTTRMEAALDALSRQLFDRTATIVTTEVTGERRRIATALAFVGHSDLADGAPRDEGRAAAVLAQTMADDDWIVSAYVGYPNGDFVMLRRPPSGELGLGAPPRTRFVLQTILHRRDPIGAYAFYDAALHRLAARAQPSYRFDPRRRPWYVAARGDAVTVTAPYLFFTTGRIGVTLSLRSPGESVVGADIDLATVSEQLARSRPSPGSLAAVVEDDGAVLGSSDGSGTNALREPPLAAAFALVKQNGAEKRYRDPAGRRWEVRAAPVLRDRARAAALLLAIPVDELDGPAARARGEAALLGIALLAVWVPAALWLASFLARPLTALQAEAGALRQRDFTDRPRLRSRISEIDEFAGTFDAMRRHVREHNEASTRFVPREFLEQLSRRDITSLRLGDHVEREMTILFSDIRSFTTLSESMSPQQTFNFVNSYLTRIGPIIREHGGFIDKYIGDAIMGLFPEAPSDALEAAVAMQRRVVIYNEERARAGYPPIAIGVGLHCGNLMLGTIGETMRFETTVIADAVNVASRLESLTKTFGSLILASGSVIAQVDAAPYRLRRLGDVRVLGASRPVTLYEICDADPPPVLAHKLRTERIFETAREAYAAGDFPTAHHLFSEVLTSSADDRAAAYFRDRSALLGRNGHAADWDGVEQLEGK